jgi:hypothetical protein
LHATSTLAFDGYSRQMALDEEAALTILSAHRAFADELIVTFRGRIANTAGAGEVKLAAIYLARFRRRFVVVDAGESRASWLPISA